MKLGVLTITNATHPEVKIPVATKDGMVDHLLDTYHDVFTGLGKHKEIKAKLMVDESITPVAHKQRRIP